MDDDAINQISYTSEFAWPPGGPNENKYVLKLVHGDYSFVEYGNIHASCVCKNGGDEIAVLSGTLLKRPCHSFFEQADATSQELQELSVLFCESNGVASRVKHPELAKDQEAVHQGGFFNIVSVEVKPSHQGIDLGLFIVHQSLILLKEKWTLAVMIPSSLNRVEWADNARPSPRGPLSEPTREQLETFERDACAVSRHFARMGFVQAGSAPYLVDAWFLTKRMYFRSSSDAAVPQRWLSKEQAKHLEIHRKPNVSKPAGLDRELAELIKSEAISVVSVGAHSVQSTIAKVRQLIQRGASMDNARVLHIASMLNSSTMLQELIQLGATVNLRDEYGNTPLHTAASASRSSSIQCLFAAGANPSLLNLSGQTALVSYQNKMTGDCDFLAAFGLTNHPPRPIDVESDLACLKALMSGAQRLTLVDGWMSPRMREILHAVAEEECEAVRDIGFSRGDYIPFHILKPRHQHLLDGWRALWEAAERVLRSGRAPTVEVIRHVVVGSREFSKYEHAGGRIEFMLDALISITRNVVVNGDDGLEYYFEKNISRPFQKILSTKRLMSHM